LVASQSRKTWTYRYKDSAGLMKQVRLGHWPEMSLAEAVSAWGEKRDGRSAGVDPVAARRQATMAKNGPAVATTVRALLEGFRDHLAGLRQAEGAARAWSALERFGANAG